MQAHPITSHRAPVPQVARPHHGQVLLTHQAGMRRVASEKIVYFSIKFTTLGRVV